MNPDSNKTKTMNQRNNIWIDFWRSEKVTNETISGVNMEIFVNETSGIMRYNTHDILLDIGCGKAHLCDFLQDKVKEIHGLDVSDHYLEYCRNRFFQYKNLFFYKIDKNLYTDLSFLKDDYFTKIICLSVVQYYRNIDEVEILIKEVSRIASKGAKFLIADIPISKNYYIDIVSILIACARKRCLYRAIKYILELRFSDYKKTRTRKDLLYISKSSLCKVVEKLGVNFQILSDQITINKNRIHLLINF
jgi:ubiquinone/menaquinone biosynthesis C-methylase UbiE